MDKDRVKFLKQELEVKKQQLEEAQKLTNQYNAMQLGLKLILNGSYGAFANKHFVCFCNGVASTITSHGRELTKTMNNDNEDYWFNIFHTDYDLHKAVKIHEMVLDYINVNNLDIREIVKVDKSYDGLYTRKYDDIVSILDLDDIDIPTIEKFKHDYVNSVSRIPFDNPTELDIFKTGTAVLSVPVSAYADTDSLFVGFKPAMVALKWKQEPLEFVLFVSKYRMQPYFLERLKIYAAKFNVENKQDFELEQISKSIIFIIKKMYVKNVVWEEGLFYDYETNIQPKGIKLVRSETPAFIRDKKLGIYKIINYFFKNPETMNDRELTKIMRDMKEQFKMAKIEDICFNSSCSKYSEKVIDDMDSFKLRKGVHHAVKAAAFHNYLLNQNPKLKQQYNLIKSGQKIRIYYTTHSLSNELGFIAGAYPKEIAIKYAPVDYDTQFHKAAIKFVNSFTRVLGLSELNPSLTFRCSLF